MNLRLIPFVCSIINFYLIYSIRSIVVQDKNDKGRLKVLLDATALAILPPMYFFSFVYYTDIPSITTILFMLFFSLKEKFLVSSLFAFASVLMRQTNIVWVAGILGTHIADDIIKRTYPKMNLGDSSHLASPKNLINFMLHCLKRYYGFALVIMAFIVFLVKNGSIVGELRKCQRDL